MKGSRLDGNHENSFLETDTPKKATCLSNINVCGGYIYFFIKSIIIAAVPLLVLFIIYLCIDPFNVVGGKKELLNLVANEHDNRPHLWVNKGYLSLAAFEQRINAGDVPDSFIFGSSISCYYEADYWIDLIDTETTPFHFDSSLEGARSLRLKIEYLLSRNIYIKNALIVIDPQTIEFKLTGDGIIFIDPPQVAGWWTYPLWHLRYIQAFYETEFLVTYLPSKVTGNGRVYGHKSIFEKQPFEYDMYRNEESIPAWDNDIKARPEIFYAYREFPAERQFHCSNELRVDSEREKEYRHIARLLERADYRVVVSPTIDLDTLSSRDDNLLREIFGAERYHNLSAEMAHVALCDSNWYDSRHYRAPVAREIMDRVYRRD